MTARSKRSIHTRGELARAAHDQIAQTGTLDASAIAKQHRQLFRWLRQRGNDYQQRHDRQILKEQHAHDLPAMHCVELNSLGQQFGEDSRGRHRQCRRANG